ncbi:MAG: L-threonylcarbamoyladenylate synthase [Candidatus Kapaibacterium sp.]
MSASTEYWDIGQDYSGGIKRTAEVLRNGDTFVFPTETVYGLGCRLFDESAAERIFEIKQRSRGKPLSGYLHTPENVDMLARSSPEIFYRLAEHFLPGPLAVILPRRPEVSDSITGGFDTIAIRIPDNDFVLDLIEYLGEPIAGTSANLSDEASAKTAAEAFDTLRGKTPLVIDGGEAMYGIESTVLDLSGDNPKILRNGMVTQSEIEFVLGRKIDNAASNPAPQNFYLPLTKIYLYNNIRELAELTQMDESSRILLLSNHYYPKSLINADVRKLGAVDIFDNLRFADAMGYDQVAVLLDSKSCRHRIMQSRINIIIKIQSGKSA